jgi:hypothetical protein
VKAKEEKSILQDFYNQNMKLFFGIMFNGQAIPRIYERDISAYFPYFIKEYRFMIPSCLFLGLFS